MELHKHIPIYLPARTVSGWLMIVPYIKKCIQKKKSSPFHISSHLSESIYTPSHIYTSIRESVFTTPIRLRCVQLTPHTYYMSVCPCLYECACNVHICFSLVVRIQRTKNILERVENVRPTLWHTINIVLCIQFIYVCCSISREKSSKPHMFRYFIFLAREMLSCNCNSCVCISWQTELWQTLDNTVFVQDISNES